MFITNAAEKHTQHRNKKLSLLGNFVEGIALVAPCTQRKHTINIVK